MLSLNKSKIAIGLISAFIILAVLSGCSTGNFGRLQSDRETTQVFETLKVLPNHKYYFRGTFSRPHVIAGIHDDFTLNSNLWVEIDTQSDDFRTLVERLPRIRDEELFFTTRDGWRDLPPCSGDLTDEERWHVVNFFRTLA